MQKFLLLLMATFTVASVVAQSWVDVWQNPDVDLKTKQEAFNSYYAGKDMTQQKGWKPFKRWEYNMQVNLLAGETEKDVKQRYLQYFLQQQNNSTAHVAQTNSAAGTWTFVGPSTTPTSGGGAGRVNCVTNNNSNELFIGAPVGGVWKRSGTNWSTNTDFQINYLGISDIIIDPSNNNLMYAATGDADAGDAPCIGVIKSTDGGVTWTSANLTNVSRIYKIMPIGTNYQQLIACTNAGIFKTTNGGTTWSTVLSGVTIHDMEFKPNSTTTIFAVSATGYYVSTNGGDNFTNNAVAAGLPTTGTNRKAIAVTPANDNYVYILASNSSGSGFHSFWRSTDGGVSFTAMAMGTTPGVPNLLGWSSAGTDVSAGGQGWYDLCVAAHPANANIVYTGGVNIWVTTNGGANWSINGHWTGSGGAPYVHADIHNLDFTDDGTLYASCDGGLFVNTSTQGAPNWSDISNGLQIAQMYRFGISQQNDGVLISGWQDNGTNLRNNAINNWRRVIGGDGFESAIDPTTDNNMWGELYYGAISKSTNGGNSFSNIVSSSGSIGTVNEQGPWLTEYSIAKSNPSIMYVAKSNVYRNSNGGSGGLATWTNGVGIPSSGSIVAMAVAPTNENVVYATKGGNMYVTTDGTNFALQNTGLPGSSISYVAISNNPNTAYCTVNGGAGAKVYKTTNGGTTWTNITGTLPNITPTCIAVDVNSALNQLYVGHTNGVYTFNDTMTSWKVFDNGLPNTRVAELEIMYSASKLKAATYGRGAWESDLYSNTAAPCTTTPTVNFSASNTSICPTNTVSFTSNVASCTGAATYSWTFAGGSPATSTAQNPTVTYAAPGSYTVTLVATNIHGSTTKTTTNMIVVNPLITQSGTIAADRNNICSNETVAFSFSGVNNGTNPSVTWFKNNVSQGVNNSIALNQLANGDMIYARVVAGANAGCLTNTTFNTNTVTMTVRQQPAQPVISLVVGDLVSNSATGNQWFGSVGALSGATNNTIHPTANGTYTVQVTQNGCLSPMSDPFVLKIEGVNTLYPVPSNGNMNFDFYAPTGVTTYNANVYDAIGQLVWQESKSVTPGLNRINLKMTNLAAGTYNLKVTAGSYNYTKRMVIK